MASPFFRRFFLPPFYPSLPTQSRGHFPRIGENEKTTEKFEWLEVEDNLHANCVLILPGMPDIIRIPPTLGLEFFCPFGPHVKGSSHPIDGTPVNTINVIKV